MQKLFSGVQPSGNLHIGNYLGAVKQWVSLQDEHESLFCVVDLHAITVPQDPEELRRKTLEIAKIYLASGIDPTKATLFVQSHVSAHSELMWILNTIARMGDLDKMTQFKDKIGLKKDEVAVLLEIIEKHNESIKLIESFNIDETFQKEGLLMDTVIEAAKKFKHDDEKSLMDLNDAVYNLSRSKNELISKLFAEGKISSEKLSLYSDLQSDSVKTETAGVGLYDYPVLMAADILLYDTEIVPVGDDQLQHIELARTLARRFNERFGETFVVPEGRIQKDGARIMGLDDPTKKMSKSAPSEYNYISLTDDEATVLKKIKKAVTDSGTDITYSDGRSGLKNLINIYSLFSDKTPDEIVAMYEGQGYGAFKTGLAGVISGFLTPFQERLAAISDDEVRAILEAGAVKARAQAEAKMKQVRKRVGLL